MNDSEFAHADGCAYQLSALLRTMEESARCLGETAEAFDHRRRCNDLAQLSELAGEILDTIHDALQLTGLDKRDLAERLAAEASHAS